MARGKKYWKEYTEHLIRHPNNGVSYSEFKYRIKKRGPKLAVGMGKIQGSVPERVAQKKQDLKTRHLQKVDQNGREEVIEKGVIGCVWGIILFALGVVAGAMIF